jgi:hypothetical protein
MLSTVCTYAESILPAHAASLLPAHAVHASLDDYLYDVAGSASSSLLQSVCRYIMKQFYCSCRLCKSAHLLETTAASCSPYLLSSQQHQLSRSMPAAQQRCSSTLGCRSAGTKTAAHSSPASRQRKGGKGRGTEGRKLPCSGICNSNQDQLPIQFCGQWLQHVYGCMEVKRVALLPSSCMPGGRGPTGAYKQRLVLTVQPDTPSKCPVQFPCSATYVCHASRMSSR